MTVTVRNTSLSKMFIYKQKKIIRLKSAFVKNYDALV